jgi:hypothetical protein
LLLMGGKVLLMSEMGSHWMKLLMMYPLSFLSVLNNLAANIWISSPIIVHNLDSNSFSLNDHFQNTYSSL